VFDGEREPTIGDALVNYVFYRPSKSAPTPPESAFSSNPIGEKTVTTPCNPNSRSGPRWSREQIRAARLAPLPPLLHQRGLQLVEREAGNYVLPAYPGLIVKDSYWRWPERNLAGHAIDFCHQVLGLSFHDAMRQSTGP